MIIFGTRGLKSRKESGTFYCPSCRAQQSYAWIRVRRWFTLYFIPLIPLAVAGEYIECHNCTGTYDVRSLKWGAADYDADHRRSEAEFKKAIKDLMILMMLADGRIEDAELKTIQALYDRLTGEEYASGILREDIARVGQETADIKDFVASLAGRLNESGKVLVYQAALLVAAADEVTTSEEEDMLKAISKGLGISRSDAKQMRAQLVA